MLWGWSFLSEVSFGKPMPSWDYKYELIVEEKAFDYLFSFVACEEFMELLVYEPLLKYKGFGSELSDHSTAEVK